jgi:outer membrane immunogenic protein
MKAVLLGGVAALALAAASPVMIGGAAAADMDLKAPAPLWNWTGFYLGGNLAYGFGDGRTAIKGDANTEAAIGAGLIPSSLAGGVAAGPLGGGQVGYNLQAGRFVYGIEADIDVGYVGGSQTSVNAPFTTSASQTLDYIGTVRGRLGIELWPTLLFYGTGGLAYGGVGASSSVTTPTPCTTPCGAVSGSTTLLGWTAGAGLEQVFAPRWTAKFEVLYYDLGSMNQQFNTAPPTFTTINTSFKGAIARIGMNYKF